MLKSFEISGFKSIKEPVKVEFFVQNKRLKGSKHEDNFFLKERVAKSILLFGGNATGKTNLLEGLATAFAILNFGLEVFLENLSQMFNYFSEIKTIKFKFEFIYKEKTYIYVLEFSKDGIVYEKLSYDEKFGYLFENGKLECNIKDESLEKNKMLGELFSTETKSTILSKIKNIKPELREFFGHYSFEPIYNRYCVSNSVEDAKIPVFTQKTIELVERYKPEFLKILKLLDESITDVKPIKFATNSYEFKICRGDFEMILRLESDGIKKIFTILIFIFRSNLQNSIFIIDELDSSISSLSLVKLINYIHAHGEIFGGSQFVFSSHNPLLFDIDIFEPSQIYISSKDENFSTKLTCLDDFELRADKRKVYLNFLRGDYDV